MASKNYKRKHERAKTPKLKNDPKRIVAICLLVFTILAFIGCSIAIFVIKSDKGASYIDYSAEPMTLGVEKVEGIPYSELKSQQTEATTKPTETATTKPTTAPTQTPTEKPTESSKINPTAFDEDSTEYLIYDTPENNPDGINLRFTGNHLLEIDNPDKTYVPQVVTLTDYERDLAAKIIMREFGEGGYIACCLQAQALRDAMIFSYASLEQVYHYFQYDKYSVNRTPNKDCYDAIDYIFDLGGLAVQHRTLYMYNPSIATSKWHESQEFVVEYKGVRFFDYKE